MKVDVCFWFHNPVP